MDIHVKMVNSKLIQCLNEYTMSSPGNRKVKDKAKSNDPATEKIETYGYPHNDKSGKTPFNPCLKSQRIWLDKELVKIAI